MPSPNPVAFAIFGINVMWYGILIAFAIILATAIVYRRAPSHNLNSERVLDFIIICVPIGIIGARAYFVLFNWEYYSGDFFKMINIRGGGLAIHGGLLFGILAALILCRLWKVHPLNLLDLTAPAIALAQSIGRWGNYFNSEAHGGPTNLPWAIMVDGQAVHPTFLYESLWCLFLFLLLSFIDKHRKFAGQVILLYGMLYSVERFFVEGLRTDSLMLGVFKQAQILSVTLILVCAIAYFILYRKNASLKQRNHL